MDKGRNDEELSVKRHCTRCGYEWTSRGRVPKRCPACSSYLWNETPHRYRCLRCGHQWIRRAPSEPKICPKCKSHLWNHSGSKAESRGDRESIREVVRMYNTGMTAVRISMETGFSFRQVMDMLRAALGSEAKIEL